MVTANSATVAESYSAETTEFSLTAYPNPVADGELHITMRDDLMSESDIRLSVSDALGRVVFLEDLRGASNFHRTIDCSAYPQGMYLVKVQGKYRQKTVKVVLK